MAEPLPRLGDVGTWGRPGTPGVTLAPLGPIRLASIMTRRGQAQALADLARDALGLALPTTPKAVWVADLCVVWAGPGQWMAVAPPSADLAGRLAPLAPAAVMVDQSGGRVGLSISGRAARATLAKGYTIDLHPQAFQPGDAAVTNAAQITTHFWQIDDAPTYHCLVPRSFCEDYGRWLTSSALEYGLSIVAPLTT